MKKVYVFLAEGFEEMEAVTPVDLLRRVQEGVVAVKLVSVTGNKAVTAPKWRRTRCIWRTKPAVAFAVCCVIITNKSVRAGITISAAAVGVGARLSAT